MTTKEQYQDLSLGLRNTKDIAEKKLKLHAIYRLLDGCSDEEKENLLSDATISSLNEDEKALQSKIALAGLPLYDDFLAHNVAAY
jgi:hypothetical protein